MVKYEYLRCRHLTGTPKGLTNSNIPRPARGRSWQ